MTWSASRHLLLSSKVKAVIYLFSCQSFRCLTLTPKSRWYRENWANFNLQQKITKEESYLNQEKLMLKGQYMQANGKTSKLMEREKCIFQINHIILDFFIGELLTDREGSLIQMEFIIKEKLEVVYQAA